MVADPVEFSPYTRLVVLQPTPLCNLRCTYCYLPDLADRRRMDPSIPKRLAEDLAAFPLRHTVELRWHAGEPLAMGVGGLTELLEPLEGLRRRGRVQHSLQTNATLVTPEWCELFLRHDVKIGVSIDGPRWANGRRRTLSGAETFQRAMVGIDLLRAYGVPLSAIAVVSMHNIPAIVAGPSEYLDFFHRIGIDEVGFNIEETEGTNRPPAIELHHVEDFWRAILAAWLKSGGVPRVRDFSRVLAFAEASLNQLWRTRFDLVPTVMCDGSVVLLSPELAGYHDDVYGDFTIGNLLEEPLTEILRRGRSARYVQEFADGTERCRESCRYFDYCGGGQASNRYFEHGNFVTNETTFCRGSRQTPFDTVLDLTDRDGRRRPHGRIEPRSGGDES